ncbi:MAG: coproporphyrinogen III oxidase family protein [Kiritimatiellae bacterium]|nr:coproporphyrinogen III oxidase family protein [Kiritimatiellia bacterium]
MNSGLYIHVPFCVRKCRYCDFYSLPVAAGEQDQVPLFLQALETELNRLPEDFTPGTIYIGGGTPTALQPGDLFELLALVGKVGRGVPTAPRLALNASPVPPPAAGWPARTAARSVAGGDSPPYLSAVEWTCEANPGTLDADKLSALREAGVNRLSLGVQSFDLRNLSFLGRIHSVQEAEDAFCAAREAGFDNINLDLMYGIPGSARSALEADLAKIAELRPEHVACYALAFEPGTPLTAARDAGRLSEVEDEEQARQYHLVRRVLAEAGYRHYEISNFALPGRECRHNLLYWSGGEYIGCGPSAHSHWSGTRWGNLRALDDYCEMLSHGESPREFEERLDPRAKARETLVMSLRRVAGVSNEEFGRVAGFSYRDVCGEAIDRLIGQGLLVEENGRLRLTEDALFVSDAVFRELV